jgi:hypothetical protein
MEKNEKFLKSYEKFQEAFVWDSIRGKILEDE